MNKAFKNQIFWDVYTNFYTKDTSFKNAEIWFSQLGIDFQTHKGTLDYVETSQMLQQAAISKVANEVVKVPSSDLCEACEKYLLEVKIKEKELAILPEFALKNFKEKIITFPHNTATIHFPLPVNMTLELNLTADLKCNAIPDQAVYLVDNNNEKKQLGYWDDAQWMPYFLKVDELKKLCEYWKKDTFWKHYQDIPFCLLSKFIGIGTVEEKRYIEKRHTACLSQLGISSEPKIHFDACYNWIATEKGEEFVCVKPPKSLQNVEWIGDKNAVKSLSYSFRKQNYGAVEDYTEFPFEQWYDIIKELSQ